MKFAILFWMLFVLVPPAYAGYRYNRTPVRGKYGVKSYYSQRGNTRRFYNRYGAYQGKQIHRSYGVIETNRYGTRVR